MINAVLERLLGARLAARVSTWLVLLALLLATWLLARIFGEQTKLQDWLFFRYASVWLAALVFAVACLSFGNWLVSRLSLAEERSVGHVTLSFASGVFAFFLLTTAFGFVHALGRVSFVLIPLGLFGVGARRLFADAKLVLHKARAEPSWLTLSPLEVAAFCVGVLALCAIYLGVLVPDNAAYDSRWYHLGLAEHYAAAGGIIRSPEGAATAVVPHLASVLYAWAFCLPWGGLFERLELSAHIEVVAFVMTLPGIVALVRYLVPGARATGAWLALFTFPSVFIYDSSLHSAADHIAALWTIPAYLALGRAWRDLRPAACALFAIQISGLLMSKYTAITAVAGPVLFLALRGLYLAVRQGMAKPRSYRALTALLTTLGLGLLLTSPHWLKNCIWYGDPLYPSLYRHLRGHPWTSGSPFLFAMYSLADSFAATGSTGEKLQGALRALYDHSYALYNWGDFHGRYPVFGSLFTFSLLGLPFLRGTRRLWGLVLATHLGIAIWAITVHAERYLQTLVPWMAVVVASLFLLAWRSGWPARFGVVALAGLQIVWGLDIPFWPLHRMVGRSGIGLANDFFARGYGSGGASRTAPFEDYAALGRGLPKGAKVLVHHDHLHTGLGTMTVTDATRIQYGLDYAELGSPVALHRLLREFGVTHVLWESQTVYGDETLGGDLVFHTYATSFQTVASVGSRRMGELPKAAPRDHEPSVLVYLCDGTYRPGVYAISDLHVSPYDYPGRVKRYPGPRSGVISEPATGYAVVNDRCPGAPSLKGYQHVASAGSTRYWVSKDN